MITKLLLKNNNLFFFSKSYLSRHIINLNPFSTLKANQQQLEKSINQLQPSLSSQHKPCQQVYKQILQKLNIITLKKQISIMKKLKQKQTIKLKKYQIVDILIQLPQQKIQSRVNQLSIKTLYQIQNHITIPINKQNYVIIQDKDEKGVNNTQEGTDSNGIQKEDKNQAIIQVQNQQDQDQLNESYLQEPNINLNQKFKNNLPQHLLKILTAEKINNYRIIEALYNAYSKSSKSCQSTIKSNAVQSISSLHQNQNKINQSTMNKKKQKTLSPQQLRIQQNKKLLQKPFVNRLFKTNQQSFMLQKKRKYLYQYQKHYILDQIDSSSKIPHSKQIKKSIQQVKYQKRQDKQLIGFIMDKKIFQIKNYAQNKKFIISLFAAFNYYKQLLGSSHLIKFFYALTFQKNLPIQYTFLKISEEYYNNSQLFEKNLKALEKDHYLKFLRTSINYLQKLFKVPSNTGTTAANPSSLKKIVKQYNSQYDEQQQSTSSSHKEQPQSQYFPKIKRYVDLNAMRFSLSIIHIGLQRVIQQINTPKFLQQDEYGKLRLQKTAPKLLLQIHQTLILCFDIFRIIQQLFTILEVNRFEQLQKLSKVLLSYHQIRTFLSKHIDSLQYFMVRFDKHYQEKLQLGLSSIITQKQLKHQNFILNQQARKLSFQIMDNLISILKNDHVEITLGSKREMILKMLERYFKIYIQNKMFDLVEQELIYTVVRFLEKQVYLEKKIKTLFQLKVNLDKNVFYNDQIRKTKKQPSSVSEKDKSNDQISKALQVSQNFMFQNDQQQGMNFTSEQQNLRQYVTSSIYKVQKSQYFSGGVEDILSKEFLNMLLEIIKYKYERKQIQIKPIQGFNLIQQWYTEPTVIRSQFLKEQLIQRFMQLVQKKQGKIFNDIL